MTKGKLFWKKEWFSICSIHHEFDADCHMCKVGSWNNIISYKIGGIIFKIMPNIWKYFKNKRRIK